MAKKTARKKVSKNAGRKSKSAGNKAVVKAVAVVLADHLCIKDIAKLKKSLLATRTAGSPIKIDASQVETIDTAILQLLVAFANSVRERALSIDWIGPSAAFLGMADLSDLTKHLGVTPGASDSASTESGDDLCPVF